jgi:hypothetical protein
MPVRAHPPSLTPTRPSLLHLLAWGRGCEMEGGDTTASAVAWLQAHGDTVADVQRWERRQRCGRHSQHSLWPCSRGLLAGECGSVGLPRVAYPVLSSFLLSPVLFSPPPSLPSWVS